MCRERERDRDRQADRDRDRDRDRESQGERVCVIILSLEQKARLCTAARTHTHTRTHTRTRQCVCRHIECSAMASKYFGSSVDFHSGGCVPSTEGVLGLVVACVQPPDSNRCLLVFVPLVRVS